MLRVDREKTNPLSPSTILRKVQNVDASDLNEVAWHKITGV